MNFHDNEKLREKKLATYNQILVELSSNAVFKTGNFLAAAKAINQKIALILSASRVSIWRYYDKKMVLENVDTYDSRKIEHLVQKPFLISDYPHYFETLKKKRSIVISDINTTPFFSNISKDHDADSLCALLVCPIRRDGDFAGVLVVEHSGSPRTWEVEEKFFASAVADLITIIYASTARNLAEEQLSSIITNLPGIAFRGRNDPPIFTMEFVSSGCQEILGYPPEALLNANTMSIRDILHPADLPKLIEESEKTLSQGLPIDTQYRIIHKNGSIRWIWSRARVIEYDHENPDCSRVEGFLSDITDIKEFEALEQSALAKSDFIANLSHEIRTPLNAIIALTDLMITSKSHKQNVFHAQSIKNASKSLLNLLNGMIDFSRLESNSMELELAPYDPVAFVNDISSIVYMVLKEKNIDFLVDLDPTLPSLLKGDEGKIRQILLNLLSNASKFTDEGFVKLKISLLKKYDDKAFVRFSIEDTGRGVSEDNIQRIFKVFSDFDTRKNRNLEGSGLGLHIVKKLVELMDSTIELKSIFGKGSEFSFNIEQQIVKDEPIVRKGEYEDIQLLVLTNDTVMENQLKKFTDYLNINAVFANKADHLAVNEFTHVIIDAISCPHMISFIENYPDIDRTFICNVGEDMSAIKDEDNIIVPPILITTISNILKSTQSNYNATFDKAGQKLKTQNTKVLIVDDNEINLEVASCLLEQYNIKTAQCLSGKEALEAIDAEDYDIIFMDQMMPEMDGEETSRKIREKGGKYEDQIIIALTANTTVKEQLLSAGLNDFMTKPLEIKDMENMLKKWLPKEKILKEPC